LLPEEVLLQLEQQQQVREGFNQLQERCRRLLWFLFYDPTQPSYNQIASSLAMPVASIGPSRARCLEKLRIKLKNLEGNQPL
jgi:DNA-directed RNA polymerase specialized sigma24 family protein